MLYEVITKGDLSDRTIVITPETAVTVMMVSGGYPDTYGKGFPVSGIEDVNESMVFHAGTKINNDSLVTSGGRVLSVTSTGSSMAEALDRSYRSISKISFA